LQTRNRRRWFLVPLRRNASEYGNAHCDRKHGPDQHRRLYTPMTGIHPSDEGGNADRQDRAARFCRRRFGFRRRVSGDLRAGRMRIAGNPLQAAENRLYLGEMRIVVLGLTHCRP
jgi:hypothetical protein